MDRAASLIFPGSKTIALWWRQLQAHQPKALWIGYVYLHRAEASFLVRRDRAIDAFSHWMLRAIAFEQTLAPPPATTIGISIDRLHARLHLALPVLQRTLLDMQCAGLVERFGDGWNLSERGRHALEHQRYPDRATERRTFTFLERVDSAGRRTGPGWYLPITECPAAAWQVDEDHRFELAWLNDALAQPEAWKQSAGFSLDAERLAQADGPGDWQHIVLDRPERVLLALVSTAQDELIALGVKADGWVLQDKAAAFKMPASALCPELMPAPPNSVWHDAWRDWCRQKQLPPAEVEACSVNYQPPRLEIQAPSRLLQRLQGAKSDLFRGDAWVLVGDGYVRAAAQLSVRAAV